MALIDNKVILSVQNLKTAFLTSNGRVNAVRGVSFNLHRGEVLGIVGESGSGKTVTAMSVLQLLAGTGLIAGGRIEFNGQDLVCAGKKQLRKIRGNRIAMIFQDPMSSLNPTMTIGAQVAEIIKEHRKDLSPKQVKEEVLRLLKLVRIPEVEKRYSSYPHEFSGGMRQRVMIAIALACQPDILIADEPTTALDVTTQEQILKLLRQFRDEMNMSIIFITHDLGVVAELCSRVIVMYGGMIMEQAPVDDIFERPCHPYTIGLLASVPNMAQDKEQYLQSIPGSPPDMIRPPQGCPFSPRCLYTRRVCTASLPPVSQVGHKHSAACWLLLPEAPTEHNPFKQVEV
jgi:oligopeptide transport system ATP-binding protein